METTAATTQDIEATEPIHHALAAKHLLPSEHALDTGYVDGPLLVSSSQQYGVELLGPVIIDPSGLGRAGQGFSMSDFAIDWQAHQVTCPAPATLAGNGSGPTMVMEEIASMESLERRIAWPAPVVPSVPPHRATLVKFLSIHKLSMKPFSQPGNGKRPRNLKTGTPFGPGLREPFLKVCEPSTYDEVAILDR